VRPDWSLSYRCPHCFAEVEAGFHGLYRLNAVVRDLLRNDCCEAKRRDLYAGSAPNDQDREAPSEEASSA
jgi:hypothetical protein